MANTRMAINDGRFIMEGEGKSEQEKEKLENDCGGRRVAIPRYTEKFIFLTLSGRAGLTCSKIDPIGSFNGLQTNNLCM